MDKVQKVIGVECKAKCGPLSLVLKVEVVIMNKYINREINT
jgi:hypothetical protein